MVDHPVSSIGADAQFALEVPHDRMVYFEHALTTTAFFSFAGSLTFRKSRWDAIGLDEDFVGSCWAHVARFFQMIPHGLRLQYLPASYLLKRTGNDSFMERGLVHRYAIAIDGYHRLATAFFPQDSLEAHHVRRVVTNEFPPYFMLELKFATQDEHPEDMPELDRLASKVYGGRTLRNRLYLLLYRFTTRKLFAAARAVSRAAKSRDAQFTTRRRAPQAAGL